MMNANAYNECDTVGGSSEYTNQLTPVGGGLKDNKLTNWGKKKIKNKK